METIVLDRPQGTYLIGRASIVRRNFDVDIAADVTGDWKIEDSSPFITWVSGNYVESDKANENGQMWTTGDLQLAEYSIRYAPLNMVHKYRTPVGFFAATRTIPIQDTVSDDGPENGRLKIQALGGIWSHLFAFETAQVEAADAIGALFYSQECRGTHLHCAGPNGCDQTFEYSAVQTHCEHLMGRTSYRHIINPTFRGGALIIPPVKPGWKEASASIIGDVVLQEAASWAEKNEEQYNSLRADGVDLTPSAWEQLMAMVIQAS